jgi:hypothetical protein
MLHSEEFATVDWGTPSVTVRVQRRKGLARNVAATPSTNASTSLSSLNTRTTAFPFSDVDTSPHRRPSSPPLAIPSPTRSIKQSMTTPQRLARNEQTSHISSPVGSSLLEAKQRQARRVQRLSPGWRTSNKSSAFVSSNHGSGKTRLTTPNRPSQVIPGYGVPSSFEGSSPIGASLMMRKARVNDASIGGGPLVLPSFSPKSPLNDSYMTMMEHQPSSPMGAALLRRKQRYGGERISNDPPSSFTSSSGPIDVNSVRMSSSPLRMIQHPIIPSNMTGTLTEEEEAPSSPMSSALLRKKRIRQKERSSPLRLSVGSNSSTAATRSKSGQKSPTFGKLTFEDDSM